MTFDINEVLANMLSAIKDVVSENWNLVKETANDFLQSRKERLELLTSLRLQDQISEDFFEQRLEDEKNILESELHAIAIISKVTAQNAANAAIAVLENAVKTALGVL
ncbi:MAG: hypothetical protein ACR2FN_01630 [Chitinophagaceae bacterium]